MSRKPTGADKVIRKLKALNSRSAIKRVEAALFVAGEMVAVEAQISISSGAVSGKAHKPSAPNQPPNFDTGFLAGGIETTAAGELEVHVDSTASYSAALEFGTSKMAARPFMRPAAKKVEKTARALVQRAVREQIRKR